MTPERRILMWMCVLVAINQLGFGAMVPALPLYAKSYGVSGFAIGMAIAVYGLARFLIALPAGQMADRLGRRPTIALGGLISGIGNLWCGIATSYPEFIAARFVAGAGAGLIVTTGQVVLADITTPETRGRTISIYQGVFIFAVGIGPFPGGLLAEHFGLAAPFTAYGFAALAAGVVAWLAVSETRDLQGKRAAGAGPRPAFREQMQLMTGKIGFVLVSLISLMNAVVRTGGLFAIIPVLVTQRLNLTVSQIGFALMLGSVCGLLAAYPTGWLTDSYGRKAVIVPSTVLTGLSMLLFCFAPSFAGFTAASIVWGIASAVGSSAPAAYAADSAPPGMNAAAMSIFRMTSDAGYMIGPLALGLIVDIWGPVTAIVTAATLLVMVGATFALFAPETHRGRR